MKTDKSPDNEDLVRRVNYSLNLKKMPALPWDKVSECLGDLADAMFESTSTPVGGKMRRISYREDPEDVDCIRAALQAGRVCALIHKLTAGKTMESILDEITAAPDVQS